jgi:hypothetical protein
MEREGILDETLGYLENGSTRFLAMATASKRTWQLCRVVDIVEDDTPWEQMWGLTAAYNQNTVNSATYNTLWCPGEDCPSCTIIPKKSMA